MPVGHGHPMSATERSGTGSGHTAEDVADLIPMVRRIVYARVGSHPSAEDLVQETLTRVLSTASTIEPGMLEPYAIVTARNVVATLWRDTDRKRRNQHRLVDLSAPEPPERQVVLEEEQSAMATALARLDERERRALLDHEVDGTDTHALAARHGTSAGAVAAQAQPNEGAAARRVPLGARARRPADRSLSAGADRPEQRRPTASA